MASPLSTTGNSRATAQDLTAQEAPEESAKSAGLRYVSDESPGTKREGEAPHFRYFDPAGRAVSDPSELARIKSLAIPPAWTEVWICQHKNGHLQATGRDARGRKQYRYHKRWRESRDETKYSHMIAFAAALPRIRARIARDLKKPELSRERVLATVVRLLEASLIRVGNDEYARDNRSYGLTTLKDKHVKVRGGMLRFEFRGKSGKTHCVDIEDRQLAAQVKKCQDLPGQELFQYLDEQVRQDVTSDDVNNYVREASSADFTAKDFRTWAGTVLAAMALRELEKFDNKTQAKKNVVQAIENVAKRLGNTPAVCKKCYVHPAVIDAYLDGAVVQTLRQRAEREIAGGMRKLKPEEAAVLALLQQRLALQAEQEDLGKQLAKSLKRAKRQSTRAGRAL
jgi:DNA topoisomerase I